MKIKRKVLISMIVLLTGVINFAGHAQQKDSVYNAAEIKVQSGIQAPKSIVRNITQDRKGNIWIASWEGVFKYDGKLFSNVTKGVSSARFFSVLEDKKGNFWFGSVGSGVYYYDGKSFRNFTAKDGLAGNSVTSIYEDNAGTIWLGTESGVSRYDGKSRPGQAAFQNLKLNGAPAATRSDSVHVSAYQNQLPKDNWMHNDVNAIIEDKAGKVWLGTRGHATVYDGKTFANITDNDGKPFTNVRSMLKDRSGIIWLGGADGLYRYDGRTFTNFTKKFVGYIYEDKKGNIWTSSERAQGKGWALSRYDVKALFGKKPKVTEIVNKPMIFGLEEDDKGNIWFGDFDGVHRYDGKTITDF